MMDNLEESKKIKFIIKYIYIKILYFTNFENLNVERTTINSITKYERKNTFSGLAQILRTGDVRISFIRGKNGFSISGKYPKEKTLLKIE
jgi:hypothetical protein